VLINPTLQLSLSESADVLTAYWNKTKPQVAKRLSVGFNLSGQSGQTPVTGEPDAVAKTDASEATLTPATPAEPQQ